MDTYDLITWEDLFLGEDDPPRRALICTVRWGHIANESDTGIGAGIYVIRDSLDQVVYVGKSTSVEDRLIAHVRGARGSGPSEIGRYINENAAAALDWRIDLVEIDDPSLLDRVEERLIKKYNPPFNVANTPIGSDGKRIRPTTRPTPPPSWHDKIANLSMAISL